MAQIKDRAGNKAKLGTLENKEGFRVEINGTYCRTYLIELFLKDGHIMGYNNSGQRFIFNHKNQLWPAGANRFVKAGPPDNSRITTKATAGSYTIDASESKANGGGILDQISGSIQVGRAGETYKIVLAVLGAGVVIALAFFSGIFGKRKRRR